MLIPQYHPFILLLLTCLFVILASYPVLRVVRRRIAISHLFRGTLAYKLSELKRETNQLTDEAKRGKELKEALQKKLERYSELKELTELLSSSLSLKDVLHFIAEETFKIVGKSDRVLLFVVDEKKQGLNLAVSKTVVADSKIKFEQGDVFDRWVLEHRRPLIITDVVKDYRFHSHKKKVLRPVESVISAPVMLENRILGVLRLETRRRNAYTADDLRILRVIGDISAVAINNAHFYAKTEELAIKDGLTGLYVHRYFNERLREELKRAERQKYDFSLLMLDIDYFKYYNDKYGHSAGDVVLQHIAGSLHKFADTGDVIARYGGEEFAVILSKESKEDAGKIAEEIRNHVAEDFVVLRGKKTHVTVSIGIATYPEDATEEKELIRTADSRLYKAKGEGRNQICF